MILEHKKQASKTQRNMQVLHGDVTCDAISGEAMRRESWDAGKGLLRVKQFFLGELR